MSTVKTVEVKNRLPYHNTQSKAKHYKETYSIAQHSDPVT